MSDDLVERADGIVKQARAVAYNDARYRKLLTALADEIERLEQKEVIANALSGTVLELQTENRALREEIERLRERVGFYDEAVTSSDAKLVTENRALRERLERVAFNLNLKLSSATMFVHLRDAIRAALRDLDGEGE